MGPPVAFATYHSAFDITENVVVNFEYADGLTSGVFSTDDYYIRPVEKGHIRNPHNVIVNSHAGHRSRAEIDENITGNFAQGYQYFRFAGALWDPNGIWGPADSWNVYDMPFFTWGADCQPILPVATGAASCDGNYYGVNSFILDEDQNSPLNDTQAIEVTRFSDWQDLTPIDTWTVAAAPSRESFGHMRHFAAAEGGIYLLDFS